MFAHRPQGKRALHPGKGEDHQKEYHEKPRQHRLAEGAAKRAEPAARLPRPHRRRQALRQQQHDPEKRYRRQARRDQPGGFEIGGRHVVAGDQPAECWADDEAEAERRTDQPHAAGALLGRRDVGDIGLRRRDVASADAGKGTGREQHPQFAGEAHPEIGERGRRHARHQHRPPSDPVAQPPPERRRDHRHQREHGHQDRHQLRRGAEALGIERQQRDDQPEPDEVDKDDEEEDWH